MSFLPRALLACSVSAVLCLAARAAEPSVRTAPAWFREARFGIFIHWGVYAVPAGVWREQPVKGTGEWIMKNAEIPVRDYRAFAPRFTAAKYDPIAWARLARRAGARYVVITAKHHDGFALYDSAVTEWDAVDASGAARDLLSPLAAAVRAEGLKFGTYYSQAQDWNHSGGAIMGGKGPWDPAQAGDFDAYLARIALPQTREILALLHPDVFWWDTPAEMNAERAKPFADLLAAHPEIVTNNRLGGGYAGDTKTPEQYLPPRGIPGEMFEVCMTMNDTWGYKSTDQHWKSTRQLLRNLSDIASKGGNFLLNVGPTAEGEIPAESVARLEAIGRWMEVNGSAIYATTASPFPRRLPWGRVTQRVGTDGVTNLYLHIWEWPADGRILLPTVMQRPRLATLLADGTPVRTDPSAEGLVVQLPGGPCDPEITVARLEFPTPVTITQDPYNRPDANGRIGFSAEEADAYGDFDGNIQLHGRGPDAFLSDWKNPRWHLEYLLRAPRAGRYTVTAEIAAPEDSRLLLGVGKQQAPMPIAATGPGLSWKTLPLGSVMLPAGETSFSVQGGRVSFKPLSIRRVWIEPAP